jgi:hypothetical protein
MLYSFRMMRHPSTFPVSAEIVGSGLLITFNNGESKLYPRESDPPKPKRVWLWSKPSDPSI